VPNYHGAISLAVFVVSFGLLLPVVVKLKNFSCIRTIRVFEISDTLSGFQFVYINAI
jgi:hypothetical protein